MQRNQQNQTGNPIKQSLLSQDANASLASSEQILTPVKTKERLMSLDAYRGLTVFGMILADQMYDIEGACWWLIHPRWNGLTCADLVFPSFLFIMGVAIPLAVSKNRPIQPKNIIRVFALFLIGVVLNYIIQFDFSTLRILGILQRLAICYGVNLFVHWVTNYGTNMTAKIITTCVSAGSVLVYVALMLTWSGNSIGCSYANNLDPYCNLAGYVDRAVFTEAHIMQETDPQGILSTIPASFTTFVGYHFGLMVMKYKSQPQTLIKYWLSFALICGILIYPCSFLMPFNKRLYTITFLFTNLAQCSVMVSLFMYVVDIMPKTYPQMKNKITTAIQPLNWLGLNPLAIFIILQIVYGDIMMDGWITWGDNNQNTMFTAIYDGVFSWMGPYMGTLLYAVFYGIVSMLICWLLYRYKIFIRL